jgi:hypothetical protein
LAQPLRERVALKRLELQEPGARRVRLLELLVPWPGRPREGWATEWWRSVWAAN